MKLDANLWAFISLICPCSKNAHRPMWSWFRDQDVQEPCLAAGQAQVLNPCHHLQITLWSHSTPFFHLFISSIISSPFHHLPIILSSFWRQTLSKLSQLVINLLSNCHQAIVKLSSGEFSGGWCQDGWEGAPGGHLGTCGQIKAWGPPLSVCATLLCARILL